MPDWQPIDTAPKDGTPILAFQHWAAAGPSWCVLEWDEFGEHIETGRQAGGWTPPEDGYVGFWEPTHWMPLPAPPKVSAHAVRTQAPTGPHIPASFTGTPKA